MKSALQIKSIIITYGSSGLSVCPNLSVFFFAFSLIKSVWWERSAGAGPRSSVSACHQCLTVFHPAAASCKCCQAGCERRWGGWGWEEFILLLGSGRRRRWWGCGGGLLAVRVKVSAGVRPRKRRLISESRAWKLRSIWLRKCLTLAH